MAQEHFTKAYMNRSQKAKWRKNGVWNMGFWMKIRFFFYNKILKMEFSLKGFGSYEKIGEKFEEKVRNYEFL